MSPIRVTFNVGEQRRTVHARWRDLVDERFSPEQSIVLRYHRALNLLDLGVTIEPSTVQSCSMQEGVRMFKLSSYKGVEIHVLDESSLMTTGTYKDLDACLVNAIAKQAGLEQIAVSSGGNLGFALTVYGSRSGLKSFFFQPSSTMYKLDAQQFSWGGAKLISVDLPERQVKSLTAAFAKAYNITAVPDIRWRLAASAMRAMYLLEHTDGGRAIDSIAQTMCAGYGPAGIYNCFSELSRDGLVRRNAVPRFLGFQQEANSPMVRAWTSGEREIMAEHVNARPKEYIEPGLYNTNPERNYTRLFDLVRYYGGDFTDINRADYDRVVPMILDWFKSHELEFTRISGTGEILEKTGLLTMVGVVKSVDEGRLKPGERVLALVTGGFRRVQSTEPPEPDMVVDMSKTEDEWVGVLGDAFGLRPFRYSRISDRLYPTKKA